MNGFYEITKVIILYLFSPASYFISRYKIDKNNVMLFRMSINICYYTAIISLYFINSV